ncbi:MAG: alpha/beta hydrolase family protein [Promethearchaeota archaeon]
MQIENLIEQIPDVLNELHDSFPVKKYKRTKLVLSIIWWILGIGIIILGFNMVIMNIDLDYLILGLFIIFFLFSLIRTLYTTINFLGMHWKDFDYSEVVKRDFDFISSYGLKHFAYIYIPKKIDLERVLKEGLKIPTIIGLHGWGNMHREMDKYCLPTAIEEGFLYFTFDARGQGKTPGDKNDFKQMEEAKEFIDKVIGHPLVDKRRVAVVGNSLGALKAAIAAYPHPDVKLIVMMSGPYDLNLTLKEMGSIEKLGYIVSGFKLHVDPKILKKYRGLDYFNNEGVRLRDNTKLTPNSERVFLIADMEDSLVSPKNTLMAIEKLGLTEKNYKIFQKGGHGHEGNEYFVATLIYKFISKL